MLVAAFVSPLLFFNAQYLPVIKDYDYRPLLAHTYREYIWEIRSDTERVKNQSPIKKNERVKKSLIKTNGKHRESRNQDEGGI